jgi:hypothetical protein
MEAPLVTANELSKGSPVPFSRAIDELTVSRGRHPGRGRDSALCRQRHTLKDGPRNETALGRRGGHDGGQ